MSISLCVNYHSEGLVARKSAISANNVKDYAIQNGVDVELVAVVDRGDSLTKSTLENLPFDWDEIIYTNCGDLGEARNIASNSLTKDYISFLDGDDLCGRRWIYDAWNFITTKKIKESILHPEYVYYFDERDFDNDNSSNWRRSFWFRHVGSDSPEFRKDALSWNNVFTSNTFVSRKLLIENPIPQKCTDHGYGVEDWSWNYRTIARGIPHLVVPGTVHIVRVAGRDSLSTQNNALKLLPDFEDHSATLH